MSRASHDIRSVTTVVFLIVAGLMLCTAAQWLLPNRTDRPVAERFLCSGPVRITTASASSDTDVFNKVECVKGVRTSDDVSVLALIVLAVPSILVVFTSAFLIRRLTPDPRTQVARPA